MLLGEGEVVEDRDSVDAAVALAAAGIDPIVLEAKEGLALVNGTDGMLGMLALVCHDVRGLLVVADIVAAMSVEALLGTDAVFAPEILALRPHPGQAASAENMRRVLEGSPIVASHRVGDSRVQDAYSLRCAPQVHGAVRDALGYVEGVVRRELDAAIDNPVVLPDGRVTSNGNFHGAPLAHAADFLAIVLADLGSMSERRVDRLLDPARSHGLPAFLADEPGVDSGLMIAQYTAAALVDENRRLATPASVASIPTSAMQEDHVSMGWAAARKLRVVVANLTRLLAIELVSAARGVELRAPVAARGGDGRRDRGAPPGRARARPRSVAHTRARGRDRARRGGRAAVGSRVGDRSTAVTEGARPVRAPRGTTLTCKAWPQEAAMRMLMNNLDPEVAERPDDLVVYGGTGRAARSWAAFDALVATLRSLEGDETMLVQSGKPVGVFRTHEWAPRVLIANSNLVPDWATWEEFRRLEALGLTMYGQMTAGSWIYIGTQGILQGTYECFAEIARRRFGGSLRGTITLTAGLGRDGRRAAARDHDERRGRALHRGRSAIASSVASRLVTSTNRSRRSTTRSRAVGDAKAAGRALSIGLLGNAADVVPKLLDLGFDADIVTDQTSAHDPLSYVPNDLSAEAAEELRTARSRRVRAARRGTRWRRTARRWSGSSTRAPRSSTTATACGPRRGWVASSGRSTTPASSPRTSARCSARGRARSAGSRSRAIPRTSRRPIARCARSCPTMRTSLGGSISPEERVAFQGLPARICWLGYGERARVGQRFNEMVRSGEVSAPIVIGRDHLDSGSVASPYRETEAMADGSDAIADWPLLNALVNTASGASWVSIHHGGGVGIGRSIHAGMVCVADGSELAAEKLERVLTCDPGMGVIRHVDAGYDRAVEVADERGVRVPMRET